MLEFVFDSSNPDWSKNMEYNRTFLKAQRNYLNDRLQAQAGPLFLNEALDVLGFPRSRPGQTIGWAPGSTVDIDIDIKEEGSKFLLTFNVDGVVVDLLPE